MCTDNNSQNRCNDLLTWISNENEKQGKLPLNVDSKFTSSMIDERVNKLRELCKPIVGKPKPKPPKADATKTNATNENKTETPSSSPPPTGENGNNNNE
jgi:hypothetical protein